MAESSVERGKHGQTNPVGLGVETRQVPFDRPWDWLAAGWRDLWQGPTTSLAFGLVATFVGLVLAFTLATAGLEALIPVLAGGFTLVGPLLAAGLYEKSRRIAEGRPVDLHATFAATVRSSRQLGLFSAILLVIYLLWIRLAFLLLMLFQGPRGLPPAREFVSTLLFTPHGLGLLVVGTATGALLAGVVFAISAVSIPLLMERRIDAITAMAASVQAVAKNPQAMALWAALIAGFVLLGLLTLGAGLVLVFPLIGHATWHAYRDVIVATEP